VILADWIGDGNKRNKKGGKKMKKKIMRVLQQFLALCKEEQERKLHPPTLFK